MLAQIFAVPIFDRVLLYAPLQGVSALVNRRAADLLATFDDSADHFSTALRPLASMFVPVADPRRPLDAPFTPFYLGIIPTRGCNLACRYCDFAAPKQTSPLMSLETAQQAVDAYLALVRQSGNAEAKIHFFGGEPFYRPTQVRAIVEYAQRAAAAQEVSLHFEATTNGIFSDAVCAWIGDHFNSVVVSLDGLPVDHDHHRPALTGRGTFERVARTARLLSASKTLLILRACITAVSVERMTDFARWICAELQPRIVCFETLSLSSQSADAGFSAPDPHTFARHFDRAAQILAAHGIETVTSSADLSEARTSFCPVSKDALIVSHDGAVDACYLLTDEWKARGLDLRLGALVDGAFQIDEEALRRVRSMQVQNRPLCADCLCRFHCAGGCHVHHETNRPAGQFDDWCVQTRLITITRLLRGLGEDELCESFLADHSAWEEAVWQSSDRLIAMPIFQTVTEQVKTDISP